MGQEVRAWPMLVLLLVAVAVAIACVVWFMREAMGNERLAIRQKLAEAYRGQLALLQKRVEEQWHRDLARFDERVEAETLFATALKEHWADSLICLDAEARPVYPQPTAIQRDTEANAELLALERSTDRDNPAFLAAAARLESRIKDYGESRIPAPQRRFLMRELQRLHPAAQFPTLAAEDLAAKYLEINGSPLLIPNAFEETRIRETWACTSPQRRAVALFTTTTLLQRTEAFIAEAGAPTGVDLHVLKPQEEVHASSTLASVSLAPLMPGWKLAFVQDDSTAFDDAADRRVATYLWIGSSVIALMTVLILFIARGFTRQVRLARMKNDLVATVSHELKTPLTAMRALVETLLESEHLDERTTREYLQLLSTENTRLSRLIENFLTFSRLERNRMNFHFAPVAPQQIVENAVAAMGERCRTPECQFKTETPGNLPLVAADSNALTTALLNLLDNAWKYTGGQKRITLRTSATNGSVRFAVEDNGIGIPERESRRIFQRFYQVDQRLSRTVEGCGLGLSIVRSIVKAHRGEVTVSSQLGAGSVFAIEIPIASQS
jgi:signal transduction histidine kinase